MVYYINNFKSHNDLIQKKLELTINTFKLVHNAKVTTDEEFINNEWKLTIKVDINE